MPAFSVGMDIQPLLFTSGNGSDSDNSAVCLRSSNIPQTKREESTT